MKKLLLFLLLIPVISFSQNKLSKAKNKLKQTSTTSSQVSSTNSSSSNKRARKSKRNSTNYESTFENILLEIGFKATLGIVVGQVQERDLNPYPYFYDNEGEYAAELSDTGRKQNVKLGVNYLFNRVNGLEFTTTYKPIPLLGIDLSYIHFSEKKRTNTDVLDLTSLMVNYHRIREKNISIWWGIGASYVGNGVNSLGFAYNVGTDIYPVKPISLHLSWKESFINKKSIGAFKSQLKYHSKNKAFFIGYHNYDIASERISGPTIGFEITF